MIALYVLIGLVAILIVLLIAFSVIILLNQKKQHLNKDDLDSTNQLLLKDIDNLIKLEDLNINANIKTNNDAIKSVLDRIEMLYRYVDQKLDSMRTEINQSIERLNEQNAKSLQENRTELNNRISEMATSTNKSLDDIRVQIANNLKELRDNNSVQLDKMRETVDEKLSTTLNNRFNQSFKIVGDRLEEITKGFAELQNLQTGVNDIKHIFSNVKTRGTWGEIALDNLLSQILNQDQYDKQVKLKNHSDEMVDFAIKLPGKGDGTVYLPIDAKFPLEDYQLLVEASDNSDKVKADEARKKVENRIKQEAKSIRDKYINPPKTTDFAIMYLPIEGLYAEVVKMTGLLEKLQTEDRIVICGPTTIAALLNSLQMGFRSVAIEKRSTEIGKLLTKFIKDFDKFTVCLVQAKDRIGKVQKSLDDADKRTELIRKSLSKVSQYEQTEDALESEEFLLDEGETDED